MIILALLAQKALLVWYGEKITICDCLIVDRFYRTSNKIVTGHVSYTRLDGFHALTSLVILDHDSLSASYLPSREGQNEWDRLTQPKLLKESDSCVRSP
ncbi:hypothetical protein RRG08_020190 [Elysia crispata]|uniref:Uncharacterized protein n=1 Tax=Elysia crispata TaxID=231223 RepID=A0AAE1A2F0_9GAST|nr:hypothetical protein RRG08_020190 [Elysia crispata]